MHKFMGQCEVNNFVIFIVCIVCLFVGLSGVSILVASAYFDFSNYSGLLTFLSSIGSFLGGIAAIITAITVFIGVNTWKKQIKYGKHIALIWSCMESIRNFQRRNDQWYIYAYAYGTTEAKSSEPMDTERKLLDASLEELKSHFSSLDKIVVKNEWQWTNYAGTLHIDITHLTNEFMKYKKQPYDVLKLSQKLGEINTRLKDNLKFIEAELDKLEMQYQ